MLIFHPLWLRMRAILTGRRFSRSIERHTRAADQLDAAVRKVLDR